MCRGYATGHIGKTNLDRLVGSQRTTKEFTVGREGEEKTFDVTLDALDGNSVTAVADSEGENHAGNILGLVVENINSDRRRELGDPEGGVVITEIESDDAWRAGLRPGDEKLKPLIGGHSNSGD
ncbi:hypothetical protein ACFL1J_05635 [Pseudomonadota bacterium]